MTSMSGAVRKCSSILRPGSSVPKATLICHTVYLFLGISVVKKQLGTPTVPSDVIECQFFIGHSCHRCHDIKPFHVIKHHFMSLSHLKSILL
jgi:hypothetical protein